MWTLAREICPCLIVCVVVCLFREKEITSHLLQKSRSFQRSPQRSLHRWMNLTEMSQGTRWNRVRSHLGLRTSHRTPHQAVTSQPGFWGPRVGVSVGGLGQRCRSTTPSRRSEAPRYRTACWFRCSDGRGSQPNAFWRRLSSWFSVIKVSCYCGRSRESI